ncbi:hypothetical protein [Immundisolibacter sp.]
MKQAYFDLVESYNNIYSIVIKYTDRTRELEKKVQALEEYFKIKYVEETIDTHYKKKEV